MKKRLFAILLCMAMCLPLMCFGVSAADEGTVKEVTTASEFVDAYLELGNSGNGVILLKNDIDLTSAVLMNSGASTLVAGSATNNKIIIRGSGTDTKTKLTVSASMMFNGANGRTIEFDNINLHSSGSNAASQIAFNGNKVVFNNNCTFSSAVNSTDRYMGYVFMGSQGGGSASAHNVTLKSGKFELVALNESGNITSSANITIQGSAYVNQFTPGNRNGGKNIGTANVNVWDSALLGKLYLTYNADRDGSIYVNYGSNAVGQTLVYLTSQWNANTINGDIVLQVDNINNNSNNKKILAGAGTVNGDTVLILNNGLTTAKFAEINGIDSVISAPSGVYAFAQKNADGSFAHQLKVQVKTSAGYDKVVVRDSEGEVVSYSTEKTVSGANDVYSLALDETLDSSYTISCEKSSETYVRGYQKGNDGQSVRFVAGIDTLSCNGVGFEISANDKAWGLNPTDITGTVYTSILADGEQVTADSLASEYLFCAEIGGIPVGTGSVEFTVKAFKLVNGERVYSSVEIVTVEF